MLAEQSSVIKDAVEINYEWTADEVIREQCKAREKHVREINTVPGERDMAFRELQQQKNENKQLEREKDELEEKNRQFAQQNSPPFMYSSGATAAHNYKTTDIRI